MGILQGKNTLLIDDAICDLRLAQKICESMGANVFAAKDGEQALNLVDTFKPDVIFCDIQMSEVDGYSFLTRLRNSSFGKNIPVILVSGKPETYTINYVEMIGGNGFINKPVSERKITAALEGLPPPINGL